MKTILDLSASQARVYFLESRNYCNFDLPKYFNFKDLLSKVSARIGASEIEALYFTDPTTGRKARPHDIDGVNHYILSNKDGQYGWRPFELIHPALYVDLVHLITENKNWKVLKKRFKQFKSSAVKCESIPRVTTTHQTHKAEQVKWWWEQMEQESVRLGLDFQYIFDADIANCYPSIYTHSISWAIHTKITARSDRRSRTLLGSKIDTSIQSMRYRQTNGIPQGSTVCDFIAEIVLGYADLELSKKISKIPKRSYKILRYRDDYKIFTNRPDVGKEILKSLSETLSDLGLKLNTSKTKERSDPILASVKEDKVDEMFVPVRQENFAKWLMQVYATISQHPNSGKAARQLSAYHEKLLKHKDDGNKLKPYEKAEPMISVMTNLAINNPKYYNWCMAILSIFLEYCPSSRRKLIANKIVKKFKSVPNTGLLDIWLQRVTYPSDPDRSYEEAMTKVVTSGRYPGNSSIWKSAWLVSDMEKIVNSTPVIDKSVLRKLGTTIREDETALFRAPIIS